MVFRFLSLSLMLGACVLVLFLVHADAHAQTPSAGDIQAIIPQQNLITEQEEQRRREFERGLRELSPPKRPEEYQEDDKGKKKAQGTCIQINEIRLINATLIPKYEQEQLLKEFVPSCLHVSQMDKVIAKVSEYYLDAGYVTSRAYIAPQNLNDGVLDITVLEGTAEEVILNENGERQPASKAQVLPVSPGEPVNMRDIEQGIDQINRLRAYDAKVALEPGSGPGTSIVAINSTKGFPLYADLSMDNSGQESTGKNQATLSVGAEGLLGMYERFILTYKHDTELNSPNVFSESVGTQFSLPYGYWTLSFSTNYFRYSSILSGLSQDFVSSGTSVNYTTELERVIHRDDKGKTSLAAFVSHKQNNNFVQEVFVPVSSRKLSIVGLRLQHSARVARGIFSFSLTGEQGIGLWGSLEDRDNLSDNTPRAQFKKLSGHTGYNVGFNVGEEQFSFDTQLQAAWSPYTLFSTENTSIGGLYTVRGFRHDSLSADSGAYLRNTLNWHALSKPVQLFAGAPSQVSWTHSVSLDVGGILEKENRSDRGTLGGMALGTALNIDRFNAQIVYEKPLFWSAAIDETDASQIYFQLGIGVPF